MASTTKKKLLLLTRSLHIYISMLALLLLLFFALTGFMMNHPEWFKIDETTTTTTKLNIPADILHARSDGTADVAALVEYLRAHCGAKGEVDTSGATDDPIHLIFKGPHYQFEADIAKTDGQATLVKTSTSLTGFLGNLHKGADTGAAWKRIVDVTSILLALVSLTGLILWMTLAKRRTLGLISLGVCVIVCLGILYLFVP